MIVANFWRLTLLLVSGLLAGMYQLLVRIVSVILAVMSVNSSYILFASAECTVDIASVQVTGNTAIYSFTAVGSGIEDFICKLNGDVLPDCMFHVHHWGYDCALL